MRACPATLASAICCSGGADLATSCLVDDADASMVELELLDSMVADVVATDLCVVGVQGSY